LNKNPEPQKGIVTVPRNPENEDQKMRRQELLGFMQQLSGVSNLDMGTLSENDTTATEVNQVASRGQAQVSFYSREFARGIQELAVKIAKIARLYDTAPFSVNEMGIPIWYNVGDERLTSKTLFDGALNCVIGDEDLIRCERKEAQRGP